MLLSLTLATFTFDRGQHQLLPRPSSARQCNIDVLMSEGKASPCVGLCHAPVSNKKNLKKIKMKINQVGAGGAVGQPSMLVAEALDNRPMHLQPARCWHACRRLTSALEMKAMCG